MKVEFLAFRSYFRLLAWSDPAIFPAFLKGHERGNEIIPEPGEDADPAQELHGAGGLADVRHAFTKIANKVKEAHRIPLSSRKKCTEWINVPEMALLSYTC